jgi:hypothetical protein
LYAAWATEIKRVEDAHDKLHTKMVKTLGTGNDLKNAPQIEAALKNIPGMSPTEATEAFGAATGASPGMGWQQRVDIVKGAAPLAAMGHDVSAQTNLATKLKQLDPSLSGADANDLALIMRKRGGEDADKFASDEFMSGMGRLKTAGLSTDQALAVGMADIESDLPTKGLKTLAASLYESDPNAGKQGRLSAADQTKSAFYKLSAQERLAKLTGDKATAEAVLGAGGAVALGVAGSGGEQLAAIQAARSRDLVGEDVAEFQKWGAGRLAGVQHATKEQTERLDDIEGSPWARASAMRNQATADMRTQGFGMMRRGIVNAELYGRQVLAAATGGDQVQAVRGAVEGFSNAPIASMNGSPELTQKYDALAKALERNTKALVDANPKGKKKNVDAHNE